MTRPDNRDLKPPTAQSANDRIDAALQAKPQVQIAQTFATRITALAVAQENRPRRRVPEIGRSMALLFAPVVTAALFVLAPHASPNVKSILFDTEVILIAQLALIGWWATRTPGIQSARWR